MFDARFFSKENTRNRLMRRTAELWGTDESELVNFDPLIRLLLEATSVEIEKIAREIQGSEVRLVERLAEVLCPEGANLPKPAWAMAYASPQEPKGRVEPENLLVLRKTAPVNGEAKEVFFSPARSLPVVKANLSFLATPQALYEVERGARKLISESEKHTWQGEKWIWLGIEINSPIDSWEGFRFFFDWRGDSFINHYCSFLPLTKWTVLGEKVSVELGYGNLKNNYSIDGQNFMIDFFGKQSVSLTETGSWESKNIVPEETPQELKNLFPRSVVRNLKPMYWIRVDFPASFPISGFEALTVSLNAFPVVNRKINKFSYRLQPGLNGIPLVSDEAFFEIHSVVNQQGEVISEQEESGTNGVGSYAVRQQGMGRFDGRTAKQMLYNLLELLHDEQVAFSALGEEYLASLLREMSQNMARLEQKLGTKRSSQVTAQPFLVVTAPTPPGSIFVSYWTTLGEEANGLSAGSKLTPYSSSYLNSNEIFLLTRPFGGRGVLGSTARVHELRKNVQSRGRLVTREDLRIFCLTELGNQLRHIEVQQQYVTGSLPSQGFLRCIRIVIDIDKVRLPEEEWPRVSNLLQTKISSLSSGLVPIQVELK